MILETERLTLHKFTLDDAPFIIDILNSPGWLKNIGDRGVKTIEDAQTYLQDGTFSSYEKYGYGPYLVRRKADNARIGISSLLKRDNLDHVDIGFAFLPQFGGQGYAFEASTAVLHYAFTTLDLPRIIAITIPENNRSINLLKKLGLQYEGMVDWSPKEQVMLFGLDKP